MAMVVKNSADFEVIPARTYQAVVCLVADIGTQTSEKFGLEHKITLGFELHTRKGPARDKKGNIFVAYKDFALKFSKISGKTPAALRVATEMILGREFTDDESKKGYDIEQLLGRACQIQIIHEADKGNTYSKIAAILTFDPDDEPLEFELNQVIYNFDPSQPLPDKLSKFVANKIKRSREWVKVHGEPETANWGERTRQQPATESASESTGDDDTPY